MCCGGEAAVHAPFLFLWGGAVAGSQGSAVGEGGGARDCLSKASSS